MSCEHIKHDDDECYHCGATAWICVSDFREQRDDARALIAELRAALAQARIFLHSGVSTGPRKAPLRSEDVMAHVDALLERTKP